ncbi:MAG: flagella basal body P-ring formation protein FlgA [Nitrospirae bacterium RBG_13_43_8]|nr:MAG: flagella basal body P-ring formation protein FlgA [Nitrospirae bacterium RBG_13_43_8]
MRFRSQKPLSRSIGKKALALCLFLFVLGLISSSVKAIPWSPEAALKAHLKENYPWADMEIDDLMISDKLPDEQPSNIVVEKGPPGKTVFTMEFSSGRKITATGSVKAFDWIVMSARAFRKGHNLQRDDVFPKLMDITRIPRGAIRSAEQMIGKPFTRSIVANVPLVDTMIAAVPVVKKGRKVTLVIESPSFIITALGEIKENSSVGSSVKAVNLASKKIISGLLLNENTVKVEF